eukprot:m.140973 g.140973  ORF g.140973 m.140973 type:complete len:444 (+) comp14957_c13_seq3:1186-2517(+)
MTTGAGLTMTVGSNLIGLIISSSELSSSSSSSSAFPRELHDYPAHYYFPDILPGPTTTPATTTASFLPSSYAHPSYSPSFNALSGFVDVKASSLTASHPPTPALPGSVTLTHARIPPNALPTVQLLPRPSPLALTTAASMPSSPGLASPASVAPTWSPSALQPPMSFPPSHPVVPSSDRSLPRRHSAIHTALTGVPENPLSTTPSRQASPSNTMRAPRGRHSRPPARPRRQSSLSSRSRTTASTATTAQSLVSVSAPSEPPQLPDDVQSSIDGDEVAKADESHGDDGDDEYLEEDASPHSDSSDVDYRTPAKVRQLGAYRRRVRNRRSRPDHESQPRPDIYERISEARVRLATLRLRRTHLAAQLHASRATLASLRATTPAFIPASTALDGAPGPDAGTGAHVEPDLSSDDEEPVNDEERIEDGAVDTRAPSTFLSHESDESA